MEGLTISEMAEMLGIKESSIRQKLYLAKRQPFISRISLYTADDFEALKSMYKGTHRGRLRIDNPSTGALYAREYRARKKTAAANEEATNE
jgi:hypothetical protein